MVYLTQKSRELQRKQKRKQLIKMKWENNVLENKTKKGILKNKFRIWFFGKYQQNRQTTVQINEEITEEAQEYTN